MAKISGVWHKIDKKIGWGKTPTSFFLKEKEGQSQSRTTWDHGSEPHTGMACPLR